MAERHGLLAAFAAGTCLLLGTCSLVVRADTPEDIAARTGVPDYARYIANYSNTHWEPSGLWPLPRTIAHRGSQDMWLCPSRLNVTYEVARGSDAKVLEYIEQCVKSRYWDHYFFPAGSDGCVVPDGQPELTHLYIVISDPAATLNLQTSERYDLTVGMDADAQRIEIRAETVFGAMRGVETLSQLVSVNSTQPPRYVVHSSPWAIEDFPRFQWRGVMVDLSRNFIPLQALRHTVLAMSFAKLNVLHLHMSDAQSFPIEVESFPDITSGYSDDRVYSKADMTEFVKFATALGVRVVPEFDTPAHTRSWHGKTYKYRNATVCDDIEPWTSYCVEPPCGQLNPTVNLTYELVEGVVSEMAGLFPDPFFHVGADEPMEACWNSSAQIRRYLAEHTNETFATLATRFATFRQDLLRKLGKTPVAWDELMQHNPANNTVIQVWHSPNPELKQAVSRGYRAILSNYDKMYLDCGAGHWLTGGKSWCDPLKTWEDVYNDEPFATVQLTQEEQSRVLGGEVALWTEQADSTVLDPKLWPRASAAAERYWSSPPTLNNANRVRQEDMFYAYKRMLVHRDRLVERGVNATPVQPEWCKQSEKGFCWYPCTCNDTQNEWYGGPNQFGFPRCPYCSTDPSTSPSTSPSPVAPSDPHCTLAKSDADTLREIHGLAIATIAVVGVAFVGGVCAGTRAGRRTVVVDGSAYVALMQQRQQEERASAQ